VTVNKPKVLALDLDGTLLGTDSLWELFFKYLSLGSLFPLLWLLFGRLRFKRKMAESVELDFSRLPWNLEVIRLALDHKKKGGEVWLATAANQAMAKKVVQYFDFFSGYLATDDQINLKSKAKARALSERFGEGGFIYAGDSKADLKVWEAAGEAVVVGDEKLAKLARPKEGVVRRIDPVGSKKPSWSMIFELGRPLECLNNIIIFIPMIISLTFSFKGLIVLILTFFSLYSFSAAVNILSDLITLENSRADSQLSNRPLAAGRLDLSRAGFIFLGYVLAGYVLFIIASFFYHSSPHIYLFVTSSLVFNLVYAFDQNKYLLSIWVFAFQYIFRLSVGFLALGLSVSIAKVLMVQFLFVAIGAVKVISRLRTRPADEEITVAFIMKIPQKTILNLFYYGVTLIIVQAIVIIVFFAFSFSYRYYYFSSPGLLAFLCPILIFFIARLLDKNRRGEIKKVSFSALLTDWPSWMCLAASLAVYFLAGPVLAR
jgi:4-hydroxybenzoate polyprenyltransferase/phosphoserine phosphatase